MSNKTAFSNLLNPYFYNNSIELQCIFQVYAKKFNLKKIYSIWYNFAMEEYYLFTFESTHAAIATEKILKPVGGIVMPVPRFISSSCGISIRIEADRREEAEDVFREKSNLKPYVSDDEDFDYNYFHITIDKSNNEHRISRESIR